MAAELKTSDAQGWSKFVTDFDNTYARWKQTYADLSAKRDAIYAQAPQLAGQYTSIMSTGASDLVKLADLKQTRDAAANWLSNIGTAFSSPQAFAANFQQGITNISSGAQGAWDYLTGRFATGVQGLGLAPIIYVAVGLGAAAATVYAISSNWQNADRFNKMADQAIKLAQQGWTPEQIKQQQKSQTSATQANIPLLNINQDTLKVILIVGALVFLVPPVLKMAGGKHG